MKFRLLLLLIFSMGLVGCGRQPDPAPNAHIFMGIVPHHLIAKDWIGEFWNNIDHQTQKIVLISPSHFETNGAKVTASTNVSELLSDIPFIQFNDEMVNRDHGITAHLSFINSKLPQAKLYTVLVGNTTSKAELQLIVDQLKKRLDLDKDIVVASIDFSHYLNRNDANLKDEETLKLINERNLDAIFKLSNDYVDARAGLVLYLLLTAAFQCDNPTIIHHGNSGQFAPVTNTNSTSYYVAHTYREQCHR